MATRNRVGMDRRQFLKTSAIAGAAASLPLGGAAQAQPSRGGHMRYGKAHGQTTDTLDPGLWENGFTTALSYGVHGHLTEVAADGSLTGDLAESWEASADASQWRFKLRSGVEFHNGKSLTAEDVVDSINHHRKEGTTSAAATIVAPITDIRAEGDTVVIDLEGGNADFPFILHDYHLAICPSDGAGNIDWQSGIGCGAYKIDRFEPGVVGAFTRHDNHWANDRAWFDSIELISLIDLNARTTALTSGDVDAIDRPDLKTVGLLGRDPNITIHSIPGTLHYTFSMFTDVAPFDDNNVRLALKYAINREEMVDKILFGFGVPGNDHPIGPGQRYFNTELEQTTYDPDRAAFHLREAGLDNVTVQLSASDAAFGGAVDAAVLFQNSAAGTGINVDVVREPNDGYWSDVWLVKPFAAVYWSGRVVEDQAFTTTYQSGANWNDTHFSNARFDELLVAARSELDDDKRRMMYWEMQEILNREGGVIAPMFPAWTFVTRNTVGTPATMGSNWDSDGEAWMERWWKTA